MKKWFKLVGVLGVVVVVASLIAGVAWAQGPVDEDGDGRCDVCGEEVGDRPLWRWRDDPDAAPQWRGRGLDGDEERLGNGMMPRWRDDPDAASQWRGRGLGAGGDMPRDRFIDEDGDGVCDLYGEQLGERPLAGRMRSGTSGRGRMGK